MKKKILIVDDEESITRYLFRALRGREYEIEIANNSRDALTILENKPIDLIISDMRMPEMTGYELLARVRQKHPGIIRIILSGDSDRETIIKAVADGTARSYLTKPIGNDALKLHLTRLFTIYDSLHRNDLLRIVESIESMPVIPSAYEQLLLSIKQNRSMNSIAESISNDPEYAAKILQVANSSLYGVKIGSVVQALVYLGLENRQATRSWNRDIPFLRLLRHESRGNGIVVGAFTNDQQAIPCDLQEDPRLFRSGRIQLLRIAARHWTSADDKMFSRTVCRHT